MLAVLLVNAHLSLRLQQLLRFERSKRRKKPCLLRDIQVHIEWMNYLSHYLDKAQILSTSRCKYFFFRNKCVDPHQLIAFAQEEKKKPSKSNWMDAVQCKRTLLHDLFRRALCSLPTNRYDLHLTENVSINLACLLFSFHLLILNVHFKRSRAKTAV